MSSRSKAKKSGLTADERALAASLSATDDDVCLDMALDFEKRKAAALSLVEKGLMESRVDPATGELQFRLKPDVAVLLKKLDDNGMLPRSFAEEVLAAVLRSNIGGRKG